MKFSLVGNCMSEGDSGDCRRLNFCSAWKHGSVSGKKKKEGMEKSFGTGMSGR
jgi:hypothetical protein